MDFFSGVWDWFKGSSISSALAKTALLGYASRLLGSSTNPAADPAAQQPDPGVRLQLDPSTDNQIPVLYGEAYFGGNITDAVLSSNYKKMTYCLTLCEITGQLLSTGQNSAYTFKNVYFNNNRVVFKSDGVTVDYTLDSSGNQDISMRDLVKVYMYGNQTGLQPTGYGGTTPSPWTVMPGWTQATHGMAGLIYAIVEITYNKDKNVDGLPDCVFQIQNSMSLAGDCLVDYMLNDTYGAGISVYDIDSSFVALNTFCSTGFTYTNTNNQSTTSTITINGLVDTTQPVLSIMEDMAKAASSWITYDILSGKWVSIINKAGSSIASFTDSNTIGEISISGTSLTQLSSAANVKYQNTDIRDKTDFVKIEIPAGDLYQNETGNTIEISLPYTNRQVVAAKIGLQALKQARIDKIITFKADYSYISLRAGDLIDVTSSIYGYTAKVFRIATVTEIDGEDDTLQVEITAMEYDADVYAYTIQQYTVTSDNGILGIGSIGKPNTPTVTKTEQANVPKIDITAIVPSGIVDTIEYWLTTDTTVGNDSARTYVKIGQFNNPNGSILTQGTTATYTYTQLSQSNFFIKVRGVNNVTTGPFSDPTGLIAYVPVVVADTISDNPVSIGGQLMGLGLLTLLNNLDKLFSGSTAPGGLFDTIFSTFKDKTGIDLVGNAEDGSLVVAGSGLIDGLTDVDTTTIAPVEGDYLKWDGTNWVPSSGSTGGGTTPTGPCYLNITYFPSDRGTYKDPIPQGDPDRAPITGAYYFTVSDSLYAPLSKGTGSIKLYKSNGTLVETKAASSISINVNVVSITFADRELGVDYYILMDAGIVTSADGCKSRAITSPETWNFHTGIPLKPVVSPSPKPVVSIPYHCNSGNLLLTRYYTETMVSNRSVNHTKVFTQSLIKLQYNQNITLQTSGTITITKGGLFNSTHQVFNIAHSFSAQKISELVWVSGNTLYINPTKDFDKGTTYYLTMTANCVKDACGINGNTAITSNSEITWTTDGGPESAAVTPSSDKSINETGVNMGFDRTATPGPGTIQIKDSNGNVIKELASTDAAVSIKEDY